MHIFSDFSKFIFYFEEECYSAVILAKSSALFHAKISPNPCSNFFARSACKTPTFSLYKVGMYDEANMCTRSTELQGALHSPELAFRSTDLCAPKNF